MNDGALIKLNKKGLGVIKRSGIGLLSRVLRQSTIDDKGFNVRVRNGIGWDTFSRTPDHLITPFELFHDLYKQIIYTIKNQANRTISIS